MATKTQKQVTQTETEKLEAHDESSRNNPVAYVWAFVVKNHKKLGRAECIRQLVTKHGIAYYTARTQYQRVHSNGYKLRKPAKVEKAKA